jgi:ubiquitin C-terminal hydrolase
MVIHRRSNDSDDSEPGPVEVPVLAKNEFESFEMLGVSYEMWAVMSVAEQLAIYEYLETSTRDRALIDRATCVDRRKDRIERVKQAKKIREFFNNLYHTKIPAPSGVGEIPSIITTGSRSAADIDSDEGEFYANQARGARRNSNTHSTHGALIPTGEVVDHTPPVVKTRLAHQFSGIVNQSSTCYLNALLQSLFHLPAFRKAIYALEVSGGVEASDSIPLALQQLFLSLERKERTRTVNLTKAFGWNSAEAAIQHDIHELARKLFDVLEQQMNEDARRRRTGEGHRDEPNPIRSMFAGRRCYYTKCLDVDYTSTRVEEFYDVELVVKGSATIEASLTEETKPERLAGSNKYCWEHDDEPLDPATNKVRKTYHDADRGVAYAELPPVLMMHPNRLDFCMTTFQRITVDSRWEFGTELDMRPYMASAPKAPANHVVEKTFADAAAADSPANASESGPTKSPSMEAAPPVRRQNTASPEDTVADATQPDGVGADEDPELRRHRYRLRSVVIHSGAATYGHYYCYVNFNGAWVRFNDEVVTDVHDSVVWKDAFGGTTINSWGYSVNSTTRASLLIYVRESDEETLLAPLEEKDVPAALRDLAVVEAAKVEAEREKAEREAQLAPVPIIMIRQDGTHLQYLRELKTAPIHRMDPALTFEEAMPELQECTLWRIGAYYGHSLNYRSPGACAVRVASSAVVGQYWVKASASYSSTVSNILIAVPFMVCPPPAEGETCRLVNAMQYRSGAILWDASFNTVEQFRARYFGDATPLAAAGPIHAVHRDPMRPIDSSASSDGDNVNGVEMGFPTVTGTSNTEPPIEWYAPSDEDRSPAADPSPGVSEEPKTPPTPQIPPHTSPDGKSEESPAQNPLHGPVQRHDTGNVGSNPGSSAVDAASPSSFTPSVSLEEPHVLVEAGKRIEQIGISRLISGDLVIVVPPESGTFANAVRAYNLEHYSLDVVLFRLPDSFGAQREESDGSAVTPVSAGTGTMFPTMADAQEVGEIRVVETDTYDDLQQIVANYIGDVNIDPRCIAFRSHSVSADAPHKTLAQRAYQGYYDTAPRVRTVRDVLCGTGSYLVCKLYFEILPMPVADFEGQGLKDYIVIDGSTKQHLWAPRIATYLYAQEAKKLRTEASVRLGIATNRIGLLAVDYYGVLDTYFLDPLAADDVTGTDTVRDASASSLGTPAPTDEQWSRNQTMSEGDAAATPSRSDTMDSPAPSSNPSSPHAAARRSDIIVPYSQPTFCTTDSCHMVILPALPPITYGVLPPKPKIEGGASSQSMSVSASSANGAAAAAVDVGEWPKDDSETRVPRQLYWMLMGLQHASRRSRDDIFGFGSMFYVCESDTGAQVMDRIVKCLAVEPEKAESWKLLYMKSASAAPLPFGPEMRVVDVLPFDTCSGPNSTAYYRTFSGTFVVERPLPAGTKKRTTTGGRTTAAEPELKIHARPAGSTQDLTSGTGPSST